MINSKNELFVTVAGGTAEGKSTLLFLLKETLKEKGFNIEFDGGDDYDDENDFNFHVGFFIEDKIKLLSENKTIVFKEVQLQTKPK